MAKPWSADKLVVTNATTSPTIQSINSDPSAGGGLVAPIGSLAMRTDSASLYVKTGAGNTAWTKIFTGSALLDVNYVATGVEGTDFNVPIGSTLPNDVYNLFWAPKGVASVPVLDLPDTLAGDRTTTQFRVITSANLTAGDILTFLIFQP